MININESNESNYYERYIKYSVLVYYYWSICSDGDWLGGRYE